MNKSARTDKPWGYEELLETNRNYSVKRLFMKKGHQCSYQYHQEKRETVLCLKGDLTVVLENRKIILKPGDFFTISAKIKHRMAAKSGDCLYLECSTSQLQDVIRIKDDYGRV